MIVGFVGKIQSGKTTAANFLCKTGFKKVSFATVLKQLVTDIFEMDDRNKEGLSLLQILRFRDKIVIGQCLTKLNKYLSALQLPILIREEEEKIVEILQSEDHVNAYRRILQFIGTEIFRSRDSEIWIKMALPDIITYRSKGTPVVIDDVRFLNEAMLVKSLDGFLIRVIDTSKTATKDKHTSETEQALINVDAIIENDKESIEKLYSILTDLLNELAEQFEQNCPVQY